MSLERFRLDGAVVVITGGGGLLGRTHAQAVAEIGGVPVIIDIDEGRAKSVATSVARLYACPTMVFAADVTNEQEMMSVLEQLKSKIGAAPYGLINNAAIDHKFDSEPTKSPKSRLEVFPFEQWEREITVGLGGAFLCTKVFGTEMAKAGKGVVLNISSDLGIIAPDQRLYFKEGLPAELQEVKPVTYSVIKHGIIGLTKYVATYWAKSGVRCNAFAPGGIYNHHPTEFVKRISELIPLGRMAEKDEYTSAIQFLISDASCYMTGAILVVDGGRSVW